MIAVKAVLRSDALLVHANLVIIWAVLSIVDGPLLLVILHLFVQNIV